MSKQQFKAFWLLYQAMLAILSALATRDAYNAFKRAADREAMKLAKECDLEVVPDGGR